MVVNLITFASALTKPSTILSAHEIILSELEKFFNLRIVDYKEIDILTPKDFSIVFIATGGVEKIVAQHLEKLPRPILLLADGMQNSLAAALEISAWIRTRGMKSEILHGELQAIVTRIKELYAIFEARKKINDKRIGVIGIPSQWLIASNADYLLTKRRWGVEFVNYQFDKLYQIFDTINNDEIAEISEKVTSKALAIREGNQSEIEKAVKLYLALKQLIREERLDAVSLSCFNLMDYTSTTGCLALSLLNDDGIIAGCEGDLQAIFTLLITKAITGETGFMANPSLINTQNNEIIFAHCTIGLKQTENFVIRNHFETENGIAIQGILPAGEVTLLRCGGESLDEYFISKGSLIENTNYINMCRTQVRVKLEASVQYFLKNPLGNHHILIKGDHEKIINDFLQANTCKKIL